MLRELWQITGKNKKEKQSVEFGNIKRSGIGNTDSRTRDVLDGYTTIGLLLNVLLWAQ